MPACSRCKKEFGDQSALEQHTAAVHGEAKPAKAPSIHQGRGKLVWYGAGLAIILALGFGGATLWSAPPANDGFVPPNAVIHWHMYPKILICGQERPLPTPLDPKGEVGTSTLHIHAPPENFFHVEGYVGSADDIRLGRFMDAVNIPFGPDRIFEATDATDACKDGKDNKVTMKVNGQPSQAFRDLVLRDGMQIEIRYE